jgi:hypothetical protein
MKNQFKIFYLVLMIGFVGITSSCSSDDPKAPVITFPSTGVTPEVKVGESLNFEFSVKAEGGYSLHTLTAAGGNILENPSVPGSGAKDFTISGTYKAGNVAGPGAITLTVTDQKGLSTTETMAVVVVN